MADLDRATKDNMKSSLDSFLHSVQTGGTALLSFLTKWSTFSDSVVSHRHILQEDTLAAVQEAASFIQKVSSHMVDLRHTGEKLIQDSKTDISQILSQDMSYLSLDEKDERIIKSQPAYIKPSYIWLLSNLHNPYPSKDVKKQIAEDTRCSIKDIDTWFIDVRKRIGWNQLRKSRFSNKQEKIIAAATHFFNPKSSVCYEFTNTSLSFKTDPLDAYCSDFARIRMKAKSLYADKFPDLMPIVINDSSPASFSSECLNAATSSPKSSLDIAVLSYPTPRPSPDPRESSPTESVETSPLSQKRRYSETHVYEGDNDDHRATKRIRPEMTEVFPTHVESLPSPAATDDSWEENTETYSSLQDVTPNEPVTDHTSKLKRKRDPADDEVQRPSKTLHLSPLGEVSIPLPDNIPNLSNLKRKRRLSDSQSHSVPKRPHNALCVPRLQTVSDPFPVAKSWPEDAVEKTFNYDSIARHSSSLHLEVSPLPITQHLHHDQCDIPAIPDESSKNYLSFMMNEENTTLTYYDDSALFADLVDPIYLDSFQDPPSNILVTTADFPAITGVLPTPEFPPFLPSQFPSMTDDFSHWLASVQSCEPVNFADFTHSKLADTNIACHESVDAKRARLQELKAQVLQLEGLLAEQTSA